MYLVLVCFTSRVIRKAIGHNFLSRRTKGSIVPGKIIALKKTLAIRFHPCL